MFPTLKNLPTEKKDIKHTSVFELPVYRIVLQMYTLVYDQCITHTLTYWMVLIYCSRLQSGRQEQNWRTFAGLSRNILVILFCMQCPRKVFAVHGQSLTQIFLHAKIFFTMPSHFRGLSRKTTEIQALSSAWKSSPEIQGLSSTVLTLLQTIILDYITLQLTMMLLKIWLKFLWFHKWF